MAWRPFRRLSLPHLHSPAAPSTPSLASTFSKRGFHTDVSSLSYNPSTSSKGGISYNISEMFSTGHPSTDKIHKFMNSLYVHHHNHVTLFNINYKNQAERLTVKGLRVGTSQPRQKNVVLVSGLPLQDPSAIGVGLYIAAVLSRSPLARDVSVIPLAHPREYEQRWRRAERAPSLLFSRPSPAPAPSAEVAPSIAVLPKEMLSFEVQDTCKPVEAYVTRQNKYYVNVDVNMTAHGTSIEHRNDSLPNMASRGKCRSFFANPATSPALAINPHSFPGHIHGKDSLLSPYTNVPSIVLELRSGHSLTDEQIVTRGEEVIEKIKELLA